MAPCDQYNYLMLILAQQECRHYTWSKDEKVVNACSQLYEKFMAAREHCANQFLTGLAAGDAAKK